MSGANTNKLNDTNSIRVPFTDTLMAYGHGQYSSPYYFDDGTLTQSLWRLFETYYRIILACQSKPVNVLPFIEGDIEHFMIRFNIVLNDVGYILRQLYPTNERNMPSPSGAVHKLNKEMSINQLFEFIGKHREQRPERRLRPRGLRDHRHARQVVRVGLAGRPAYRDRRRRACRERWRSRRPDATHY